MWRRVFAYILFSIFAAGITVPAKAEWYRADTHHFVIYSDGNPKKLEEFAHEVEKFDALLRMIFKQRTKEEPNRLTIYVVPDSRSVGRLLGSRSVAGFYSPRVTGSFAVANRQHGSRRENLSGQIVLFHEYAHHFMFRNFSTPAPAWFTEGFAEFVSTAEFEKDGTWTFGRPADHRAQEVQYFRNIDVRRLLEGQYGDNALNGFYGWSWALTHMLYSQEYERGDKIDPYFRRLNAGENPLAAAEASFGDLDDLGRSLRAYVRKSMAYSRSDQPIAYRDAVELTELSKLEGDLVELEMRRLSGYRLAETRNELAKLAAQDGAGAEAFYQLAEAEMALAHRESAGAARYDFTAANAAVDRALALDEGHLQALLLKGRLTIEPFDHAEDDPDPALWETARQYFLAANKIDPLEPGPLYHYAQTFVREGDDNPVINPALASAFEQAPEVRSIRIAYAFDLARLGEYDTAIRLLEVLAGNPHSGSGMRDAIDRLEEARADGSKGVFRVFGEEEDFEEGEDDENGEPADEES